MREILFRAKRKDNGEWVYGDFINSWHKLNTKPTPMIYNTMGKTEVDPSTVCQFTGLTDKNGTKIFEGDIVKTDEYWCEIGVVKYGEGTFDSGIYRYTGFYYEDKDGHIDHNALYQPKSNDDVGFIVIGNIFDNDQEKVELFQRAKEEVMRGLYNEKR